MVKLLGFGQAESQPGSKNFERWRQSGWQRTMNETGLSGREIDVLEEELHQARPLEQGEVDRLMPVCNRIIEK